ncbi:MAG: hypothetical protein EI684_21575 [Candidatus Viridilinea halotolerans]|uniref:Alpha/beta hydrolase n=1 Tax=Candidatus Viridilinea halotolerans TaxID=2491704 RepID=A0A426TRD0_9CHLR|nr:MAG: hypothetical protein EI684_21575 [Candidatus Viridilinea halotolerans]
MATILFVHGTGVRHGYDEDLTLIRAQLGGRLPAHTVAPCHWAAPEHGLRADLGKQGAALPAGRFGRGDEDDPDLEIVLWGNLYADATYELRLLALLPAQDEGEDVVTPGSYTDALERLQFRLARFSPSSELDALLASAGIQAVLLPAAKTMAAAPVLDQLVASGELDPELLANALARAVVAEAIAQAGAMPVRVASDSALRDGLIARLSLELLEVRASRGMKTWIKQSLGQALSHSATWYLRRDASVATHFAFPFSGDILRYQRDGVPIRDFIHATITAASAPVYILAHSLGGVICFDLLCTEDLSGHVAGLITAGSQAPLLYELDVLAGLPFGKPLPDYFPPWLNFFDQRDLLSFVGATLFPGRIEDVKVDNQQPFPNAHSAYWSNAQLWDSMGRWVALHPPPQAPAD